MFWRLRDLHLTILPSRFACHLPLHKGGKKGAVRHPIRRACATPHLLLLPSYFLLGKSPLQRAGFFLSAFLFQQKENDRGAGGRADDQAASCNTRPDPRRGALARGVQSGRRVGNCRVGRSCLGGGRRVAHRLARRVARRGYAFGSGGSHVEEAGVSSTASNTSAAAVAYRSAQLPLYP